MKTFHEGTQIKPYQESTVFEWINASEFIPEEGRYVVIHLTKNNWHDSDDPKGVYHDVAKLCYGISQVTREKMKRKEIEDPTESTYTFYQRVPKTNYHLRSDVWKGEDEEGNNKRPYQWETFGPSKYFGQDVDKWAYIPQ